MGAKLWSKSIWFAVFAALGWNTYYLAENLPYVSPQSYALDVMEQPKVAVEICNHSHQQKVFASFAYFDPELETWVQKGWISVDQNHCITSLKNVSPPLYGFVETQRGDLYWGGDTKGSRFCVHSNERFIFQLENCPALTQESSLIRWQHFAQLDVNDASNGKFRWDISE